MLIRAFEVTQFIRMIPFKLAINKPKLYYSMLLPVNFWIN